MEKVNLPYSIFLIYFMKIILFSATIGYSNKLFDPRYARDRETKFFIRKYIWKCLATIDLNSSLRFLFYTNKYIHSISRISD